MENNNYEGLIPSLGLKYDFKNKDLCIENSVKYMLARTNHIVKYNGTMIYKEIRKVKMVIIWDREAKFI